MSAVFSRILEKFVCNRAGCSIASTHSLSHNCRFMRDFTRHMMALRSARVLLAAGVLFLLAEGRAFACGSHDHSSFGWSESETSLGNSDDENGALRRTPNGSRTPSDEPCRGPSCSGNPVPVLPSPPSSPTGEHQGVLCLFLSDPQAPPDVAWFHTADTFHPVQGIHSIFHPPRLS